MGLVLSLCVMEADGDRKRHARDENTEYYVPTYYTILAKCDPYLVPM